MTIREIARIAGVSPTAVSLVINNKRGVSDETRQHVLEVINQQGYTLTTPKRKQKRFRLCVIKYLLHGFAIEENQGFIASIIDQIESECRRFDFELTMCNCDAKTAEATLRALMVSAPDGVILIGTELPKEDYSILDLIAVPLVVLDNSMHSHNVDSLVMANASIAAAATRYLYDLGHRDIGYFGYGVPVQNCDERYGGYLDEMARLGLTPAKLIRIKPTLSGAYEEMKRLLTSGEYVPHGAVVADNDTIAIGAAKAIQEAGYRIPEDISVVGIDDVPFSAMMTPALTTMRISRSALGILAVDMIRKRVKYPKWPNVHAQVMASLIVRGSTARAK